METDLLMSRIHQSLQGQINFNCGVAKLPPQLQENTPEELESALLFAFRQQVEGRGLAYEDVTNAEMGVKIKAVSEWLFGPQYRSCLLLQGSNGNGKSTLLMAIYRILYAADASVMKVKCEKLIECFQLQCNGQSTAYNEFKAAKRLCIDDLGEEPVRCQIYGVDYTPIQSLLSYRYDKQLPTLITTNLSDTMISERYGQRISDRFAEMCSILRFSGQSYRK